jgi:hypothetical protein
VRRGGGLCGADENYPRGSWQGLWPGTARGTASALQDRPCATRPSRAVCERIGSPGEALLEGFRPRPYSELVDGKTMAQVGGRQQPPCFLAAPCLLLPTGCSWPVSASHAGTRRRLEPGPAHSDASGRSSPRALMGSAAAALRRLAASRFCTCAASKRAASCRRRSCRTSSAAMRRRSEAVWLLRHVGALAPCETAYDNPRFSSVRSSFSIAGLVKLKASAAPHINWSSCGPLNWAL